MYKFKVILNSTERWVEPKNADKLTLVRSQESGQAFKRRKLNGSPLFSGSDYQFFYQIETSFSRCSTVLFQIYKKCSGTYSLDWQGQFGMNNGKWDKDKCTVEFDIEPLDDYTEVLKNSKTKVNILQLAGGNSVSANISGYNFIYFTCDSFIFDSSTHKINGCRLPDNIQTGNEEVDLGSGKAGPDVSLLGGCSGYIQDDGWVPYRLRIYNGTITNLIPLRYSYSLSVTYIREYRETPNDSNGDPVTPPGTGWIQKDEFERNGFTYNSWVRTPFGESSFTYNWFLNGCELNANLEISIGTVDTFNRNRSFSDSVEYICDQALGMDVISDFFSINGDDTYPDNDPYTSAKQYLGNMLIAQKSDIKDPYSTEPARKGELTFEDLQDILKTFNCEWRVVDDKIRIEHLTYWENSGIVDLTISPYDKYSRYNNSYEYLTDQLPKYEEFEWMETSINEDFVGLPIEYDSICVNQDVDSNRTNFKPAINTDINFIRIYRDAIANEGFVLIVHDGAGNILSEAGILTGIALPNMHLSWASLHYNYHRWGRVITTGSMNGRVTEFFNVRKTKKQTAIIIPHCCLSINDTSEIKTFLGTGDLLSMEENLYTGTAKIEVIHAIGDLSGSFEDRQFDDSFDLSFN